MSNMTPGVPRRKPSGGVNAFLGTLYVVWPHCETPENVSDTGDGPLCDPEAVTVTLAPVGVLLATQAATDVAPVPTVFVPAGQLVGAVAPAGAYVPLGATRHAAADVPPAIGL